jgi:excisionase family DNA binding protein
VSASARPEPVSTQRVVAVFIQRVGQQMLGISRAHAYELVARGDLPHLRLGRRVVVPKHAIEVLLARAASDS